MGGGGSQTQKTDTSPWIGQQPYLTKGFSEASKLYEGGPQEFYPGQTWTDMSPVRGAGLWGAANMAGQGGGVNQTAAGVAQNQLTNSDNPYAGILDSGIQGMQGTASGAFLNNNPYLDEQFDLAAGKLRDEWSNTVMPGIAAQFGQSGGAGTTMHSELATRAGGEFGDSLARLGSDIYGGNYQQERDRMTAAQSGLSNLGGSLYGTGVNERLGLIGGAGAIRDAQFGDFDKLGQVGQQFEEQEGKELQGNIDRFNFEQNAPWAALQDYMSMVTGNYGSTSTSRTSSSGNPLNTILGGVMTAASLSDRRLKTDIRLIGKTADGIPLMSFRYIFAARKKFNLPEGIQIGVIAQDIAQTHPDCVHEKDGYLAVDYGKLLANSAAILEGV